MAKGGKMAERNQLTPMMEQYSELKLKHPDALLMIRLGDFYELFNEDAEIASRELGLYLTGREVGSGNRMPMCGVPHHALDEYLPQLVRKGYKVAIADQMEDPRKAKGLVRRQITRVVTPGLLEGAEGANNYLACILPRDEAYGFAYCDASTGEFRATQIDGDMAARKLHGELDRLGASEILVPEGAELPKEVLLWLEASEGKAFKTARPGQIFGLKQAEDELKAHFGSIGTEGFGLEGMPLAACAAGALLSYLKSMQGSDLKYMGSLGTYSLSGFMHIDRSSWRNLAVFGAEKAGSRGRGLLDVLDYTRTRMGARMLRAWLEAPLLDARDISARQDSVQELCTSPALADELGDALSGIADMERLGSKLTLGSAMPRDLASLAASLEGCGRLKSILSGKAASGALMEASCAIDPLSGIAGEIRLALSDELPSDASSGGIIRQGYSPEVDELRAAADGGRGWLAALEARERERSGIKNLRVGYNSVFGYYFEVSRSNIANVPSDFIRKQTLAGSERYFTEELKQIETKVLGAEEKQVRLESEIFRGLCGKAAEAIDSIMCDARAAAETDALLSFARAAIARRWRRPIVNSGKDTVLKAARHPVMEAAMPQGRFVENDIALTHDDSRLLILTGPNMAGKSTVLATCGLIQLMAQAGSFVPCSEASIGSCDRIFYRAGSYDDIAGGKSTFMVELLEMAEIMNSATDRSLVMVDELGRGTSTYDGMALAWAVAEHLHDVTRARCLFTTHYHELAELEERLPFARNYHVAVAEKPGEVVFLYRLQRGGTDKSYGLNVARMAGIPKDAIRRAGQILKQLEAMNDRGGHQMRLFGWNELPEEVADPIVAKPESEALKLLREADPEALSPREALELIYRLKEALEQEEEKGSLA